MKKWRKEFHIWKDKNRLQSKWVPAHLPKTGPKWNKSEDIMMIWYKKKYKAWSGKNGLVTDKGQTIAIMSLYPEGNIIFGDRGRTSIVNYFCNS